MLFAIQVQLIGIKNLRFFQVIGSCRGFECVMKTRSMCILNLLAFLEPCFTPALRFPIASGTFCVWLVTLKFLNFALIRFSLVRHHARSRSWAAGWAPGAPEWGVICVW